MKEKVSQEDYIEALNTLNKSGDKYDGEIPSMGPYKRFRNPEISPNWMLGVGFAILILGYVLGGYIGSALTVGGIVGIIAGFMARKSDNENRKQK